MECYGCGHEFPEADPFCPMCGRGRRAPSSPTAPSAEEPQPSSAAVLDALAHEAPPSRRSGRRDNRRSGRRTASQISDAAVHDHAGFWRRAGGWVADYVITGVASFGLTLGLRAVLLPQNYDRVRVQPGAACGGVDRACAGRALPLGGRLDGRDAGEAALRRAAGVGRDGPRRGVRIRHGAAHRVDRERACRWDSDTSRRRGIARARRGTTRLPVRSRCAPMRRCACSSRRWCWGWRRSRRSASWRRLTSTAGTTRTRPPTSRRPTRRSGAATPAPAAPAPTGSAPGIPDPARIDRICGCVADVILAHYAVSEINEDIARLTKTDPDGYTRFLLTGQYSDEVPPAFGRRAVRLMSLSIPPVLDSPGMILMRRPVRRRGGGIYKRRRRA